LTGLGCVSRIYTDRAVLLVERGGLAVRDVFGTSVEELRGLLDLPLVDRTRSGA
jgi:3-oxoadipate CoA-transferase beta subunit